MQIDWTTFALEVLNFLVLVWILQRFLYRPVLAVLDARQARIRAQTEAAERLRKEAEALKDQYDARLAAWQSERAQAHSRLEGELARERATGLRGLEQTLAEERAKSRALDEASAAAREAAARQEAAAQAYRAAAAMMRRVASAQLTGRIVEIFREDIPALPESQAAALRDAARALDAQSAAEVATAHPLDEATRAALGDALSSAAGRRLRVEFRTAPELIAGLRAAVGGCVLHANLADELEFFRRTPEHG